MTGSVEVDDIILMRRRDIWWRLSFVQLFKAASKSQLHYQRVIKRHQHMQPEQQGHNFN